MAEVTLRKVCKRYGEVSVIEDLDLEVRDRELMVLVGPSGCGKSTVLRGAASTWRSSSTGCMCSTRRPSSA